MDKRILAVLIAAMAGTAYAQSSPSASGYATNSSGNTVRDSAGAPVRAGSATPSTSAPRQSVAQSSTSRSRTYNGAYGAAPSASATGATTAPRDGYLVSSNGNVVVNSANHCVRTGSWTPDKAAMPCDAVATASTPAPAPVATAPEPTPAPVAEAAPPAPPVLEKVTLNTDVLFPFNKAELLPGGKEKLDELAQKSQGAEVDKIVLAGYADRIGSETYNRDLSERRAQAVGDYLASKGVDQSRIQVEGRGEENPVTGDQCKRMGPEKASNKKLVSCLQPDRRVEAELLGSREVAGSSSGTPATGATSGASSTSGTSGGGTSQ